MATYKVDVMKQLGKFHAAFWSATGAKANALDTPGFDSLPDAVKAIETAIEKAGLDDGSDSVIFRGIAYEDFSMLSHQIARATY